MLITGDAESLIDLQQLGCNKLDVDASDEDGASPASTATASTLKQLLQLELSSSTAGSSERLESSPIEQNPKLDGEALIKSLMATPPSPANSAAESLNWEERVRKRERPYARYAIEIAHTPPANSKQKRSTLRSLPSFREQETPPSSRAGITTGWHIMAKQ